MYPHLIPAALIVALSPMSILPPILVLLYSDRPRAAGLTYLLGWLVGLTAVISVVVCVGPAQPRSHAEAVSSQSRMQLAIGVGLIALGALTWVRRRQHANAMQVLDRLQNASPRVTAVLGFVLAVANPKFIVACIAGGAAINAFSSGQLDTVSGIGFFVVLAGCTTAAPILLQVAAGRHADRWLEHARHWVHEHTAALTTVTLLVVGAVLIVVSLSSL